MNRILLVDDEPDIVTTTALALSSDGFEVVSVTDGESALRVARDQRPDIVVLDVMLPNMNGYDVARLMKTDDTLQHLPVILITARLQNTAEKKKKCQYADYCFEKPFDIDELSRKIRELLARVDRGEGV